MLNIWNRKVEILFIYAVAGNMYLIVLCVSNYGYDIRFVLFQYLAISEWGWVGYEALSRSRRVLSTEAEGRGG